jgi:probable DNA metabolism protein
MLLMTDGSMEGMLTAVYWVFARHLAVEDILYAPPEQLSLGFETETIETDPALAERVARGIVSKIGEQALDNVTRLWLAQLPGQGRWIIDYLRLGFRVGPAVETMMADPAMIPVWKTVRKVGCETHRMLGLLRFRQTASGTYLAVCAPDHHQLPLIADHFAARMGTERWIVYDERRRISLLCEDGNWCLVEGHCPDAHLHDQEAEIAALWQMYHRIIANTARINYDLQRQFMPRRYWKYLIERPGPQNDAARDLWQTAPPPMGG